MIRVALVDDQALVRAGLRMVVESQPDLCRAGEAEDGVGAIALARTAAPDVMVMDIRMPGMDGIRATAGVLAVNADIRVLMLTTFDVDGHVYDSLRAGASGFLFKDATPEQLVAGIRTVASGEMLLAPALTRRLIEHYVRRPPLEAAEDGPLAALTEREREVLASLAGGRSNAEIAKELFVSEGTVKSHVSRILVKLGLRDRVQAVIAAYELGLVSPGGATTPGDGRDDMLDRCRRRP